MSLKRFNSFFIPPHIITNLAKGGHIDSQVNITQNKISTEKRISVSSNIRKLTNSNETGTSARLVYDCNNFWEQRIKLVREEGGPTTADDSVNEAYDNVGKVINYLKNVLDRNSIDNLGMDLILNVHFGKDYMNAFWDGDEMTFGDGDGVIFGSFSKSLDVIAHELAHGITQYTANLNYEGQSGALNESFSDVLGSAITQYAENQKADEADWLVGDEVMGPELYGEAIRSMRAPGTAYSNKLLGNDPQPDHMSKYYDGPADNYGVHINSGIPNKAFYLVSMDIGTDKAIKIWYHGLQNLWPTANFNDAVAVLSESARILVKNHEVPKGSAQVVRAAFHEVGLPY